MSRSAPNVRMTAGLEKKMAMTYSILRSLKEGSLIGESEFARFCDHFSLFDEVAVKNVKWESFRVEFEYVFPCLYRARMDELKAERSSAKRKEESDLRRQLKRERERELDDDDDDDDDHSEKILFEKKPRAEPRAATIASIVSSSSPASLSSISSSSGLPGSAGADSKALSDSEEEDGDEDEDEDDDDDHDDERRGAERREEQRTVPM